MKMMVKSAVLMTMLLLLTGVAFAQGDCECYKITFTDLDNPASETVYEEICLDYENHTGIWAGCDLSLFPGLIMQGLIYDPSCCAVHFKFHGNDNNVITAEESCPERYMAWGHITDYENCMHP